MAYFFDSISCRHWPRTSVGPSQQQNMLFCETPFFDPFSVVCRLLTLLNQDMNMEKAGGTAKYANHAKAEWIGIDDRFPHPADAFSRSTLFLSRIRRIPRFELPSSALMKSRLNSRKVVPH